MSAERMGHGFDTIDWPRIIVDMLRAESSTRPLDVCEKLLYKGALTELNETT